MARGAGWRAGGQCGLGPPQRIDEAERDDLGGFAQIVGNSITHIPVGLFTRDDGFALHAFVASLAADLAALRTRSRRPSK